VGNLGLDQGLSADPGAVDKELDEDEGGKALILGVGAWERLAGGLGMRPNHMHHCARPSYVYHCARLTRGQ
jgi:hypothetical protein